MVRPPIAAVAIASALASAASAQTVELRMVERSGRSLVTGPGDAQLNLAIQARVVDAPAPMGLFSFSFALRIVGEPESSGTLTRSLISNPDGTYASTLATNNAVGQGGLAAQYAYLARISPPFNGLINTSGGTFTNTPDQEIGSIVGGAYGSSFLATPGIDTDGDGIPDSCVGNGAGSVPNNTSCLFPREAASAYFGASGSWVDIFRFRYTVTKFSTRTLTFRTESITVAIADGMTIFNGLWGPCVTINPSIAASDLGIAVNRINPAPCCDPQTGACTITVTADCPTYSPLAPAACTPDPCPARGSCCNPTGACTVSYAVICTDLWHPEGTCTTGICPPTGACCALTGACTQTLSPLCTSTSHWQAGICQPNPCDQPGACCDDRGYGCWTTTAPNCTPHFLGVGVTCGTSYGGCPYRVCCDLVTGACQAVLPFVACAASSADAGITTCFVLPCAASACCDPATGECILSGPQGTCTQGWTRTPLIGTCTTYHCPRGICCQLTGWGCSTTAVGGPCPSGTATQPGTTCDTVPCPAFVCCDTHTAACTTNGSTTCPSGTVLLGQGSCVYYTCPSRACCSPTSLGCSWTGPIGTCPSGTTLLVGATCQVNVCPALACCRMTDGACTIAATANPCPSGYISLGLGTCYPTAPCPLAVCCDNYGYCTVVGPAAACAASGPSSPSNPITSCTPNPCPPRGRCCRASGGCYPFIASVCVGIWTAGQTCQTGLECPPAMVCCSLTGAAATWISPLLCDGVPLLNSGCSPNPCIQAGACCDGGTCTLTFPGGCDATMGRAFTPQTSCGTAANPIACCPANFNRDGGLTVADLFDFFRAWFAGSPSTDINHDNILSLADLTAFVILWFEGC